MDGDLVPDYVCPNCSGPIVYNGNYFCNDRGWECWSTPGHPADYTDFDHAVIKRYLEHRRDRAIRAGNTEEAERMAYYLEMRRPTDEAASAGVDPAAR